jgi:hypothetical protein
MRRVFLAVLFVFWSSASNASQWQCQSAGGWTLDTQGRATQLPADPNDNFIIAFVPPNKMQIIQSTDPLDAQMYQFLNWVKQGDVFHGSGVFTMGGVTFNAAETLTDFYSTSTAIITGHPEILSAMGKNTCRRIQ